MVLTFLIVMFIMVMQFLWKYIDELVGKGFTVELILELMGYAAVTLIPMAMPLALLLAALMTMGNLGEHSELLAMKAAGISLVRILAPMAVVSAIIAVVAFFIGNNVAPIAYRKMDTLIYSMRQKKPELIIRPSMFYSGIDNYTIRVDSVRNKPTMMFGIMIYDHSAGQGNVAVTVADSGNIDMSNDQKSLRVELFSGCVYEELEPNTFYSDEATLPARRVQFMRQVGLQKLEGFDFKREDDAIFKDDYMAMNITQISNYADSVQQIIDTCHSRCVSLVHRQLRYRPQPPHLDTSYLSKAVDSLLLDTSILAAAPADTPRVSTATLSHDTAQQADSALLQDTLQVPPLPFDSLFLASQLTVRRRYVDQALEAAQMAKEGLATLTDDRNYYQKRMVRYLVELHKKYTLAVACILFFLIGAPLGAIIKKGGFGVPTGISVLFFVVYYVISLTTEKFARQLAWDVVSGMWFSTWILIPVALILLYRATSEASMLQAKFWQPLLSKLQRAKHHQTTQENNATE